MTPVYQTIVGPKRGNCMQAALASLFDLPLEAVPHFRLYGDDWFDHLYKFIKNQGYDYSGQWSNPRDLGCWGEDHLKEVKDHEGVNGYFYAAVNSPKYFSPKKFCTPGQHSPTHAVIVDRNLNIVHDPNPAYVGLKTYPMSEYLGYNGIKYVYILERLKSEP